MRESYYTNNTQQTHKQPNPTTQHPTQNVEKDVGELEDMCSGVNERLVSADNHIQDFINKADSLQQERKELRTRAQDVATFLDKFQLSDAEVLERRPNVVSRDGIHVYSTPTLILTSNPKPLSLYVFTPYYC
jgi:hypothetical protein